MKPLLAELIQQKYDKMSGGRKQIASFILANEQECQYLTSKEIAGRVGTSESSVVRFAYFLGFKRYKDMQEFARSKHSGFDIVQQFKERSTGIQENGIPWEKPHMKTVEQDMINIHETFAVLDVDTLNAVVDLLLNARYIGVVAIRGGLAPAMLLKHFLTESLENAVLLSPGAGETYDIIKSWGPQDVLVCFEYTPTKSHSYLTLKYGRDLGCKVVSVVSETAYTIKELSDYVLEVKKDGTYISYTASVVMVNVLLDLLGQRAGDRILPKLEEVSRILKLMDRGQ